MKKFIESEALSDDSDLKSEKESNKKPLEFNNENIEVFRGKISSILKAIHFDDNINIKKISFLCEGKFKKTIVLTGILINEICSPYIKYNIYCIKNKDNPNEYILVAIQLIKQRECSLSLKKIKESFFSHNPSYTQKSILLNIKKDFPEGEISYKDDLLFGYSKIIVRNMNEDYRSILMKNLITQDLNILKNIIFHWFGSIDELSCKLDFPIFKEIMKENEYFDIINFGIKILKMKENYNLWGQFNWYLKKEDWELYYKYLKELPQFILDTTKRRIKLKEIDDIEYKIINKLKTLKIINITKYVNDFNGNSEIISEFKESNAEIIITKCEQRKSMLEKIIKNKLIITFLFGRKEYKKIIIDRCSILNINQFYDILDSLPDLKELSIYYNNFSTWGQYGSYLDHISELKLDNVVNNTKSDDIEYVIENNFIFIENDSFEDFIKKSIIIGKYLLISNKKNKELDVYKKLDMISIHKVKQYDTPNYTYLILDIENLSGKQMWWCFNSIPFITNNFKLYLKGKKEEFTEKITNDILEVVPFEYDFNKKIF